MRFASADGPIFGEKTGLSVVYSFSCRDCNASVDMTARHRGPRKIMCEACRAKSRNERRASCRDCGGLIEPGRMASCASCSRAKTKAREARKKLARAVRNETQDPAATKFCASCHEKKTASEFYRQALASDGLAPRCKSCASRDRAIRMSVPEARLAARIRNQLFSSAPRRRVNWNIRRALRSQSTSAFLEKQFGYSLAELRTHIERQFTNGMNWSRFFDGDIHLDHILPVRSFDLENSTELKACYALPNLRPAWKADNLSKGAKRTHLI